MVTTHRPQPDGVSSIPRQRSTRAPPILRLAG
jgi:hypothetical protein